MSSNCSLVLQLQRQQNQSSGNSLPYANPPLALRLSPSVNRPTLNVLPQKFNPQAYTPPPLPTLGTLRFPNSPLPRGQSANNNPVALPSGSSKSLSTPPSQNKKLPKKYSQSPNAKNWLNWGQNTGNSLGFSPSNKNLPFGSNPLPPSQLNQINPQGELGYYFIGITSVAQFFNIYNNEYATHVSVQYFFTTAEKLIWTKTQFIIDLSFEPYYLGNVYFNTYTYAVEVTNQDNEPAAFLPLTSELRSLTNKKNFLDIDEDTVISSQLGPNSTVGKRVSSCIFVPFDQLQTYNFPPPKKKGPFFFSPTPLSGGNIIPPSVTGNQGGRSPKNTRGTAQSQKKSGNSPTKSPRPVKKGSIPPALPQLIPQPIPRNPFSVAPQSIPTNIFNKAKFPLPNPVKNPSQNPIQNPSQNPIQKPSQNPIQKPSPIIIIINPIPSTPNPPNMQPLPIPLPGIPSPPPVIPPSLNPGVATSPPSPVPPNSVPPSGNVIPFPSQKPQPTPLPVTFPNGQATPVPQDNPVVQTPPPTPCQQMAACVGSSTPATSPQSTCSWQVGQPQKVMAAQTRQSIQIAGTNTLLGVITNTQLVAIQGTLTGMGTSIASGFGAIGTQITAMQASVATGFATIAAQLTTFAKSIHLDKVLNLLTFVLSLHNALQLSRSLATSIGELMNSVLARFNIQDEEGKPLDIADTIGDTVVNTLKTIVGETLFNSVTRAWAKGSAIWTSATNMMDLMRNMLEGTQTLVEIGAQTTGKIGNALKRSGVIIENSFDWFDEKINARTGWFRKFNDFVNDVQEPVDTMLEISETIGEIGENWNELKQEKDNIKQQIEANITEKTTQENADKTVSQSPEIPNNALNKPED